jgi:L-fuconolactonase
MVTEAHWTQWQPDDFRSYLDVVFDCFGPDRLMFGSDWPVCTVSASYAQVADLIQTYMQSLSATTTTKVFGENAASFYQLSQS